MSQDTNRLGDSHKSDPVYAVNNLSSLFAVCAFALEGIESLREDIKGRAIEDIQFVLELAAVMATDVAIDVGTAIGNAEKGGSK